MHWVTATDENGNDFHALTAHKDASGEDHVDVWVYITGENGWGANRGDIVVKSLKHLGDGKFGA